MASAIDVRWRILYKESADPQRAEMLVAENATAGKKDPPLSRRFTIGSTRKSRNTKRRDHSASWFIVDRQGFIVAPGKVRSHRRNARPGRRQNFAHRDYFHGHGKDLDPKEASVTRRSGRRRYRPSLRAPRLFRELKIVPRPSSALSAYLPAALLRPSSAPAEGRLGVPSARCRWLHERLRRHRLPRRSAHSLWGACWRRCTHHRHLGEGCGGLLVFPEGGARAP